MPSSLALDPLRRGFRHRVAAPAVVVVEDDLALHRSGVVDIPASVGAVARSISTCTS